MKEKAASLIHGELSYRVIGLVYSVYNTIGPGFQEKYYQKALAKVFQKEKIPFFEQVRVPLEYNGTKIGCYYMDFVIDHKIVLEIKAKSFFSIKDIKQVLGYLKKTGIEVGLLVALSNNDGVKVKRILKGKS